MCDNPAVIGLLPQDPVTAPATGSFLQDLQQLGWVDLTALAVLLVFFVLGLFKGLVWQISRIAILIIAYVVAGRFGGGFGAWIATWMGSESATPEQQEVALYLAYVAIFLGVLVLLSLFALLLKKWIDKAGMGFFDRVGGGVVGIATGGAVVLFLLGVVQMFFHDTGLAAAAEQSHSRQLSQRTIDFFGTVVPDEVRKVFGLQPLDGPAVPGSGVAPGDGASPPQPRGN